MRFLEIFISCGIEAGLNDDDAFIFYRTMLACIVGQAPYTSARGRVNKQASAVARADHGPPTIQRLGERWQSLDQHASPSTIFQTLASALLAT